MPGFGQRYTEGELLEHLRELADELGSTPSKQEINEADGASERTYEHRFGSLREAQQKAGLEPNARGGDQEYTEGELLEHLRELADELGSTPAYEEINEADGAAATTYHRRFGSLREAQQKAGLEPNARPGSPEYTEEELLGWIQAWIKQFGCEPRRGDFVDPSSPTPNARTYRYRFGSFAEAVKKAKEDGD